MTVFILHKETILIPIDETPNYESVSKARAWVDKYYREKGFYVTSCVQEPQGLIVEMVQTNAERKEI